MRVIVTVLLVLLAYPATHAEVSWWQKIAYKVDDPNQLAMASMVDSDCPVSDDELSSAIRGVLIRSHIKPRIVNVWYHQELSLHVALDCDQIDHNNTTYTVKVRFANWSADNGVPMFYVTDYGSFGVGDKILIETAITQSVERAVTEFLEANLDLGN